MVGSADVTIRTSSPVQNMGHLFHGVSLTSPSQVLKYGFLTARGTTGGVSLEAPAGRLSSAEPAAIIVGSQCIGNIKNDSSEVASKCKYSQIKAQDWRSVNTLC